MFLLTTFQTCCEKVTNCSAPVWPQEAFSSFQTTPYWIIIMLKSTALPCKTCYVYNSITFLNFQQFHALLRFLAAPHREEFWDSQQVTTDLHTHQLDVPTPSWIIIIWKINSFQRHAANSIQQFRILFQSVFFIAPPQLCLFSLFLTHFYSLWYSSVNIKWAPSILLISSQAQMISLREFGLEWQLATTAGGEGARDCQTGDDYSNFSPFWNL